MLLGLRAVAMWCTVATAFKLSLQFTSPLTLVTLACVTSWCFFTVLMTVRRDWSSLKQVPSQQLLLGLVMGMVNPALYYLTLFSAFDRLPAQEAMAINYTWAIAQPLLAVPLLKHKLRPIELIAALVSYSGVFIIATRGEPFGFQISDPIGVSLAIGSTLIWALYWIANTANKLDPVTGLFLNFSGATPVLLTICWWSGGFDDLPWQGVAGGLYIGLFEMGLSFVIWLQALKLTTSTVKLSTLVFLSPPFSLVIIWLVLGEPILATTAVGLALILSGLALQHWRRA